MLNYGIWEFNNNSSRFLYKEKYKDFDKIDDFIEYLLKRVKDKFYVFVNINSAEKDKIILDFAKQKKYEHKITFDCYGKIRTLSFENKIFFKPMHRFTNLSYSKDIDNNLYEMEEHINILNSYLPEKWYNKLSIDAIVYHEWKEAIDYNNNLKGKINKEEFQYLSKWITGGYNYINPLFHRKEVKDIVEYDRNSYYAWTTKNKPIPVGSPIYNCDVKKCNHKFSLLKIRISAILKKGYHPFIKTKLSKHWIDDVWEDFVDSEVIYITNNQLDQIFEYYDIEELEIIENFCFETVEGKMDNFIDRWIGMKNDCDYKWFKKTIKLSLNKIVGKQASKIGFTATNKTENGYELEEFETFDIKPIYYFIAILDYARIEILKDVQNNKKNFISTSIDSITLANGAKLKTNVNVDPKELGAYKINFAAPKAYYHSTGVAVMGDNNNNVIGFKSMGVPRKEFFGKDFNEVIETFKSRYR